MDRQYYEQVHLQDEWENRVDPVEEARARFMIELQHQVANGLGMDTGAYYVIPKESEERAAA
jgi:hypothetical protein